VIEVCTYPASARPLVQNPGLPKERRKEGEDLWHRNSISDIFGHLVLKNYLMASTLILMNEVVVVLLLILMNEVVVVLLFVGLSYCHRS
jgi:hypothetical protein